MTTANETIMRVGNSFSFDYGTLLGEGRISSTELESLASRAEAAAGALDVMRACGYAKAHFSKDGTPEPVYFTRLPFVAEDNPNTPASLADLRNFADYLCAEIDAVVFLGVGGSYLGNKVLFDIFAGEAYNNLSSEERQGRPAIFFSGNNLDACALLALTRQLEKLAKSVPAKGDHWRLLLLPISKAGTTLETLAAFSWLYQWATANELFETQVAVVTDFSSKEQTSLAALARLNNWRAFDVKEGVGGRFSVLHNPGLVTAAALGINIDRFLAGARTMDEACRSHDYRDNPALLNACLKYLATIKHGCDIEVLMAYGNCLKSLAEWYVQLAAESLGKRHDRNGKEVFYGRTPLAALGSTDMHAQTQQHQDGRRNKLVQFLSVKDWGCDLRVGNPFPQAVAFAKYGGLSFKRALALALTANREALDSDKRLTASYELARLDEFCLGQLFYFLMLSVAYEGELADVDAYDQPGVETYKRIMQRELFK